MEFRQTIGLHGGPTKPGFHFRIWQFGAAFHICCCTHGEPAELAKQCGSDQRDTQVSVSIPSGHVSLWKVGGLLPHLHNFASKYNLSHYYLLNIIFAMLIISIFTVFTFSQVVSEDHNFEIIFCYNWKLEAQVSKAVKFVFFCSWTCNVCDSFLTIVLNSFVTAAVK